jgi:hypothetical protein
VAAKAGEEGRGAASVAILRVEAELDAKRRAKLGNRGVAGGVEPPVAGFPACSQALRVGDVVEDRDRSRVSAG